MGGRFGDLGLEGDAEAGAGGGREALQGLGGRPGATALQAGDYGLGRPSLHRAQRHVKPVRFVRVRSRASGW
jgi:hypothetical protein